MKTTNASKVNSIYRQMRKDMGCNAPIGSAKDGNFRRVVTPSIAEQTGLSKNQVRAHFAWICHPGSWNVSKAKTLA